jgi:formyltetrahydrofolate deformylase
MPKSYRMLIACPDQVGIVAEVSSFIARLGGSIIEASHHTDHLQKKFFMRHEIDAQSLGVSLADLCEAFAPLAQRFDMQWSIVDSAVKKRVMIYASHESHCLADLLYRDHAGELEAEIVGVIANHQALADMVGWYGKPFHYVPVDKENKRPAFERMQEITDQAKVEVIVLARYMQILTPQFCEKYAGKIINIHHSFLPSFVGAKPYHQAFERGVKLIGATCHYVTSDLDAGPIIEQDVIRVTHNESPEDMRRLGRDVEKTVLARGVRLHVEDRVMISGNKTVVFA